ncbi:MAG: hypothetical protein HKN80_03865 [Acidimicrobiia bacterium]|nr:hypothetical protein [Acidimicrobiia bacterium]
MGQEPKIEIPLEDLPRATSGPAPARRWKAARPGDLHAPADVPWGGPFGTPGPDTGYALKLASEASFDLEAGESRANVQSVLLLIMSARASRFGKAPSSDDLAWSLMVLGLDRQEEIPQAVMSRLTESRQYWAPRVANSNAAARRLSARLTAELFAWSVAELRHHLALGEVPLAP